MPYVRFFHGLLQLKCEVLRRWGSRKDPPTCHVRMFQGSRYVPVMITLIAATIPAQSTSEEFIPSSVMRGGTRTYQVLALRRHACADLELALTEQVWRGSKPRKGNATGSRVCGKPFESGKFDVNSKGVTCWPSEDMWVKPVMFPFFWVNVPLPAMLFLTSGV